MFFCNFDRSSDKLLAIGRELVALVHAGHHVLEIWRRFELPACWPACASLLMRSACARSSCDSRPASFAIESTLPEASCCCDAGKQILRFPQSLGRLPRCLGVLLRSYCCASSSPVACCKRLSAC